MLTKKDKERVEALLGRMTRKELDIILEAVEREIMLSETAIKEGFEKRK